MQYLQDFFRFILYLEYGQFNFIDICMNPDIRGCSFGSIVNKNCQLFCKPVFLFSPELKINHSTHLIQKLKRL